MPTAPFGLTIRWVLLAIAYVIEKRCVAVHEFG